MEMQYVDVACSYKVNEDWIAKQRYEKRVNKSRGNE